MRTIRPMGIITLMVMMMVGCESDPLEPAGNRQRTTMELLSYSSPFFEVAPWNGTRANDTDFHFPTGYGNKSDESDPSDHLPDGYRSYEALHPHASVEDSKIGVFMTPESANPSGDFIYQGLEEGVSVWKSSIVVEKDKDYYIYGFMPKSGAESATIAPLSGADTSGADQGYAAGAVITINNYDAITTADVSVIAGLRWATEDEKINGINPTTGSDVPLGHFHYVGMEDGNNRLFVLLEHIYAGLHFATKLDPIYAGLRTIRITKVELTANNIKEKVNLVITLTANGNGTNPLTNVEYQQLASQGSNKTITLYEKTDAANDFGKVVPTDRFEDFLGCMVPGSTNSFVLKTTYDVYDTDTSQKTQGNLIRKDCVAENLINPSSVEHFPTLRAGELFTVELLIKPTYLYVLSEPDLDNPTITVQN